MEKETLPGRCRTPRTKNMKTEYWKHKNVNKDGTFIGTLGAVRTKPQLITGMSGDRFFVTITTGLLGDEMHGVIVWFKTKQARRRFMAPKVDAKRRRK